MRKPAAFGLAVVLSMGLLSGCGSNYETGEDTVFLLKDGKVVSTDVEDFDLSTYKESELTSYVDEMIEAYNAEHGQDKVEKKKLQVKDGQAVLTLEYASVEDYVQFSGNELFVGSVAETIAAGYDFEGEFAHFDAGKAAVCGADEIKGQDDLQVAVLSADAGVQVAGKVVYASTYNTKWIDKSTIGYVLGQNLLGGTIEDATEIVETEEATEQVKDSQQVEDAESASDGSIGEDEFDLGEQEEEVVFEFKEESGAQTQKDKASYIYVIYK